jgi:hypothetical protein
MRRVLLHPFPHPAPTIPRTDNHRRALPGVSGPCNAKQCVWLSRRGSRGRGHFWAKVRPGRQDSWARTFIILAPHVSPSLLATSYASPSVPGDHHAEGDGWHGTHSLAGPRFPVAAMGTPTGMEPRTKRIYTNGEGRTGLEAERNIVWAQRLQNGHRPAPHPLQSLPTCSNRAHEWGAHLAPGTSRTGWRRTRCRPPHSGTCGRWRAAPSRTPRAGPSSGCAGCSPPRCTLDDGVAGIPHSVPRAEHHKCLSQTRTHTHTHTHTHTGTRIIYHARTTRGRAPCQASHHKGAPHRALVVSYPGSTPSCSGPVGPNTNPAEQDAPNGRDGRWRRSPGAGRPSGSGWPC